MAYLDNSDKKRGLDRESIIDEGIQCSFKKMGHLVRSNKTSPYENMREKIDRILIFDKDKLFKGYYRIPIDIKSGESFTLITTTGVNTIEKSKSFYLVYEYNTSSNYYIWISVNKLRECLRENAPNIKKSKYNSSKYFFITKYMSQYKEFFSEDEYFKMYK